MAQSSAASTLAFDTGAFSANYAGLIAADPDVPGCLVLFIARRDSLGVGFEDDPGCQRLGGMLIAKQAGWDHQISASAWEAANGDAHTAWLATNATLNAADGGNRRTS